MKNIQMLYKNIGLLIVVSVIWTSCKKDTGDYKYVNETSVFPGNTYDYLKSKTGLYDSLLFVIDKLNLADTLKNNDVTLFAVNNRSFEQVVTKLNIARKLRGKPMVYLKDIASELLDSMVCRYIIRGSYIADSLVATDGRMLTAVRYEYPMNGKLSTANASGYKGGGPSIINFNFTKKSLFVKDWIQATANAINIHTSNGIVHVLDPMHPFGFGEYTRPQPEPFEQSIFRPAGYSGPFVLPSVAGESFVIEAEDFDLGGEGIGFHDDLTKNGGNYRSAEFVDIDAPFGTLGQMYSDAAGTYTASYSLGWTKAGEWLNYSVNVPVEGDYMITARVGNQSAVNPLLFHFEFDFKNVTGRMTFPNNKGWWVWQLVPSPVFHLTKGNHSMRFFHDSNDVQVNNYVIKRVN
ncbi:MAG TPA: carbohydrate-binding protein [Pedobacter sp.]|uniref:carbohydrate-binding protein n=1 Tax=Pedobacter sp. TaxID=1411316 RepID=UPI002C492ACD|nr:carbohydrate-binding protein [Pedobacter sp.]HMI02812.1 carbohydrate-binding protein [Pedobacter sp.]